MITYGDFQGLSIGMTKLGALDAINTLGAPSITSFQRSPLNAYSYEELYEMDINNVEGIGVHGRGLSFTIYFSDGLVTDVISWENEVLGGSIRIGTPIESVKKVLLIEYQKREEMRVSSQRKGYGVNWSGRSVGVDDPIDSEAKRWLFKVNEWAFRPYGTYQNFHLFFDDEKLSKIDYRNYFMELP